MYKKYFCFLVTFAIISFSVFAKPMPPIHSEGAILIEPKTNTILYKKNANAKFYPASTTKVLTSLILLNDLPLNTVITKTTSSTLNVPSDSSQIGIEPGENYSLLEGLYAVLLASDNYVCYDLAVKDAGSQKAFATKMNETATSLGAISSHFVNPHGYHNAAHYTTPFDLSQIAKAAFENPLFCKIAGTKEHVFVTKNTGRKIPLKHTALLLDTESNYYNPNVMGAKTGFHTPARRTLVAKAKYDNIELIGIVMKTNAPHQFEDMNALFDYGVQNYSLLRNEKGIDTLVNHSYSPWAKDYVNAALKQGWITESTKNYTDYITKRQFINLLKNVVPADNKKLLDAYINYDGDSIYKENLPISRQEAALICYELLNTLAPASVNLPIKSNILDSAEIEAPYKEAVNLVVFSGILGQNNAKFNPGSRMTYEQALGILYRMSPIIKTYSTLDPKGLAPIRCL